MIPSYATKQMAIVACVDLGYILTGFGIAWSAPVMPKLLNPNETPCRRPISEAEVPWIASTLYLGAIVLVPLLYISIHIGRKPILITSGAVSILAFSLAASARNYYTIIVARCIMGVGESISGVTSVVYIAEISSSDIRGILLASTGVFHTFGILLIYIIGYYASYVTLNCVAVGVSLLYFLALFTIPESPYYLISKGKKDEAKSSMSRLGRTKDIEVKNENIDINEWLQIFILKTNRKALFISTCLFIIPHLSGTIALLFYSTTIFEEASSSLSPALSTIIIGAVTFGGSLVTPLIIDSYGRKVLLLISSLGCAITTAIIGTYFYLESVKYWKINSLGWLPLATTIINIIVYSVGELFTGNVRNLGSTLSFLVGTAFGFLSSFLCIYLIPILGYHIVFWIYSTSNLISVIFTIYIIPETKGKTFSEIQDILAK